MRRHPHASIAFQQLLRGSPHPRPTMTIAKQAKRTRAVQCSELAQSRLTRVSIRDLRSPSKQRSSSERFQFIKYTQSKKCLLTQQNKNSVTRRWNILNAMEQSAEPRANLRVVAQKTKNSNIPSVMSEPAPKPAPDGAAPAEPLIENHSSIPDVYNSSRPTE